MPPMFARLRSAALALTMAVVLALCAACSMNPLGVSDEDWAAMSQEQRLAAYQQQQELNAKYQAERERQRVERERLEFQRLVDDGLFLVHEGACVGGRLCRDRELVIELPRGAYVDRIVFHAHDRVGQQSGGRLSVWADRDRLARPFDVRDGGETYEFSVRRKCRKLRFRAESDDEVKLENIQVFDRYSRGRWRDEGQVIFLR